MNTQEKKEQQAAQRHFKKALHQMPVPYIRCRDMRHAWDVVQGYRTLQNESKTYVVRMLECNRCGCVRTDVLNVRTFDKVASKYDYPEGYTIRGNKVKGGTANLVRREVFERDKTRGDVSS